MSNKKTTSLILLLCTVILFTVAMVLLNLVTGPRILNNRNAALYAPLYDVMPEGRGFTQLSVTGGDTVRSVWRENSGKGFVVRSATDKGYTGDYIELTTAFGADGRISAVNLESYPETKDFGTTTYPATFIGQDSTLSGAALVAGVTYSSAAFRNAVADAFAVLVDNGYIGAAMKEASQIMLEMLPVVNADMRSETGMLQASEIEASDPVRRAWLSDSGKTVAYWIEDGGDFLAIVDPSSNVVVYDLGQKDVSATSPKIAEVAVKAYGMLQERLNAKDIEEIRELVPGAQSFRRLDLADLPESVKSVWEEIGGRLFVVRSATDKGFTGNYITLSTVFSADGRIQNIRLEDFPETRFFEDYGVADYPATFIGQDSTLSGAALVAGVTYSSSAFRNAVADAFEALVSNNLVKETKKEPSQVISEMIPSKATGMATPKGISQLVDLPVRNSAVVGAWKSGTDALAAYWVNTGEDFLALVNMSGSIRVFGLNGEDVTESASDIVEIVRSESAGVIKSTADKDLKKIRKMVAEGSSIEQVSMEGDFSSINTAWKVTEPDGGISYAFTARTYGFGNSKMTYYYVIDRNGAIGAMNADALIIEPEYFSVKVKKADYVNGIVGVTDGWTGEQALISGATLTAEATTVTVNDSFAAFRLLTGGEN